MDSPLYVFDIAAKPLSERIGNTAFTQIVMHPAQTFVHEIDAVRANGTPSQQYLFVELQLMSMFLGADDARLTVLGGRL